MKLIDCLQGKWLGHPLHPAIVHVPVGAWIAACALDVVRLTGAAEPALGRLGLYCVGFGLLAVLAAVPTGIAEWVPIKKEKPAWKLGLYHLVLNGLATLVWAANFGLRLNSSSADGGVTMPVLLTSIVGTLLVLASGYIGGLMVFDHGTSVARQSKKKWRAIAARGGARLPKEK